MALTAFETERGLTQGRIEPQGASPAEGEYVYVLGCDAEGRMADLSNGDSVWISQSIDVTGIDFIRLGLATLRTPEDIEGSGLAWEVAFYDGAIELAAMRGWPGSRSVGDLVADVHALSGAREITIRLRVVTE